MKTLRITVIVIGLLVIGLCGIVINKNNFFRIIKPGTADWVYYSYYAICSDFKIIHIEHHSTNNANFFYLEKYKIYYSYDPKLVDNLQYLKHIYYSIEIANNRRPTIVDFKRTVNYFKEIYGVPTLLNLNDTTRFGYQYAEWRSTKDYTIKLYFDRYTPDYKSCPQGFEMIAKPKRALDSILDKAAWDNDLRRKQDHAKFNYDPWDWRFSEDPKENSYLRKLFSEIVRTV